MAAEQGPRISMEGSFKSSFSALYRTRHIASTGESSGDKRQETRDAFLWQGSIADIFAGKGFLMHLRTHIAWIDPVDTARGMFGGQNMRELLQRSLTGTITAPTSIGLNTGIASNID